MRKFLLFGLMLVLMAVPVMAEQPWDSNASIKNPVTLFGNATHINENYTFTYSINGSNLNLEADCSDLFIVYQDTVEVDRLIEGDCQTDQKDGLNVSWKMRPGITISSWANSTDWSIWTNGIDGIVPSDNPFLTYAFYDNFSVYNTSKWENSEGGCGSVSNGHLICSGFSGTNSANSLMKFDTSNWTMISNFSGGGSSQTWGFFQYGQEHGQGTGQGIFINAVSSTNRYPSVTKPGWVNHHYSALNTEDLGYFVNGFSMNGTNAFIFWNDTITYTEDNVQGDLPSWDGWITPAIHYEGGSGSMFIDWVLAKAWAESPPTMSVESNPLIIAQLSPQESSVQNGADTIFNCSAQTISVTGVNVSNVTVNVYDTTDALDYSEFFDYDGLDMNQTYSSFSRNLTLDGVWDWSCSGTSTDNTIVSSTNSSFTVDTGIPIITLTGPILESNISNIFSIYSVLDATSISCDYSINLGSNTSIVCTNDGVETTTELDLSAIINYGVLNQFYFYSNDSLANNNSKVINFTVVERIDEQWMATGLETESQQFNITLDDSLGIISGATLRYDNLDYVGALIETSGIQKTYGSVINQPAVGSGTETRYFNWSIDGTVSNKAGSTTYPTHSSTVGNIEIVPTTDGSTCDSVDATLYTLNFTFKNESTGALVEGANLIAWYEVWTTTSSAKLNFTWTESHAGQSSYPVCIFPDYGVLNANIKLIYGNESEYEYREFNRQNVELNNQTQNYTLYQAELGSTTTITITVQDDVGRVLENYLVKAILYEYGNTTNPTIEVESQITDPDGIVIMELGASDYYSFEVWKDGTLVHTRPSALLSQSEFTIVVSTQTLYDATIFTELSNGITTTLTYSNITGNITATWTDAGALGDSYCLNVYDHSSGDNSPFNSQCDTPNNGQLIYHIGNSTEATGKWLARLDVRAVENSAYYTLDELWIDNEENWRTFGIEGLMWGGIIATTTIALLGAPAPAAVIAGTTITLVVLGNALEFFSFGWGILALFLFVAGAFVFFMRD
ncbi:MAG: hypothetical protein ACTSPU_00035 [Promethearchaeota archaeon]